MTAVEILGIGFVAIDDMIYVDRYPEPDTKNYVRDARRLGGGNAAAALAAAAALGARAGLIARLGTDEYGRFAREHLTRAGVDLSRVQWSDEAGPVHSTIVVAADTGSRTILADLRRARPLGPEELDPAWLAGARVLVVDHQEMRTSLAAARLAQAQGLEVVSDIERERDLLEAILPYVDHFICSADFALAQTGARDPAEAVRRLAGAGQRSVVVTAGREGCWWQEASAGGVHHQPAFAVRVEDTTGCGDMFHGAFAFARARGWPIGEAVVLASAVGALKASRTGGWAAAPNRSEVLALLKAQADRPGVPRVIERLARTAE